MIERISGLPDHVLGFSAQGTVTGNDYATVIVPAVEAAVSKYARLRLLYHLGTGFQRFEGSALWQDVRVGLRHLAAWERVAVVTDVDWIRAATRAFAFLVHGELRVFGNDELERAREWIASQGP